MARMGARGYRWDDSPETPAGRVSPRPLARGRRWTLQTPPWYERVVDPQPTASNLLDRKIFLALLLVAAVVATLWAFGLLLAPFLVPIAWAMCLVTVTGGLYRRLEKRTGKPRLSALLMTVATAILLVAPLAYAAATLVREAIDLSKKAIRETAKPTAAAPTSAPAPAGTAEVEGAVVAKTGDAWEDFFLEHPTLDTIRRRIDEKLGAFQTDVRSVKDAALDLLGKPFQAGAVGVLQGLVATAFGFLVMLATLFVLYRDGAKIRDFVVDLVPLEAEKTIRILDTLRATAFAAIVGGLATALFQGFLGGVAFAIVGVSAPVFWGFVMAGLSLLPIGGSAFVWAPVMVYQFATDQRGSAWFLLVWGVLVMGLADNIVRPILMRRAGASAIHPLLLFFAIFSGIGLFGVSGIVFGPLLTALVLVVASLYRETLGNRGTKPAAPPSGM
jgi:predicted PurR-regulated permease PerM